MSKRLSGNLKRRASAWASQLTKLAKTFAPAHVRPAISSRTENKGDGTFIIRVTSDRKVAPDARAQEYGSGMRARRGPKEYITIKPKRPDGMLAFYENARETWDYEMYDPPVPGMHLPDGRGLFYRVDHPGIHPANDGQGYIRPAVKELRLRAKAELTADVRQAILGDIRDAFGRKSR